MTVKKKSIIRDPIKEEDIRAFNLQLSCEQCTHFDCHASLCSLGYQTKAHLKEQQLKDIQAFGEAAICRLMEID